jgi:hypothetical protein
LTEAVPPDGSSGTRPLTTEEIANLLRSTAVSLRAELVELADDVASWRPSPGEWCIKECLGHLIETEGHGFGGRIRRILEEPGRVETHWDPARVVRDRGDAHRRLGDLVDAFSGMRADSITLVEGLMNTDLVKSCVHEVVGELSVEDLLHEWVHHDRNHHRQILSNVQAYVRPWMGNSAGFVGM